LGIAWGVETKKPGLRNKKPGKTDIYIIHLPLEGSDKKTNSGRSPDS
jgi:hypothetical protein